MGAEIPNCCEVTCYPQHNEANDACAKFHKEAQDKFNQNDTVETKTISIVNPADLTVKPRGHKSKKKKRSHHHKKLKYKQSKRTQSLQVHHNNADDECVLSTCSKYQLLNARNQLFMGKHASYFAETYNDIDHCSNYSIDSLDSVPSINPMSPLCELSNNQANIIMSFCDISSPRTRTRTRAYSLPDTAVNKREMKCSCVDDCIAIRRVLDALKWYSRNDYNCNLLIESVDGIYEYLLYDYQHILSQHLTQELEINMGMQYALMKGKIEREIAPCDKRRCKAYQRYKQYDNCDYHEPFLTFMDSMHCFFMHAADL